MTDDADGPGGVTAPHHDCSIRDRFLDRDRFDRGAGPPRQVTHGEPIPIGVFPATEGDTAKSYGEGHQFRFQRMLRARFCGSIVCGAVILNVLLVVPPFTAAFQGLRLLGTAGSAAPTPTAASQGFFSFVGDAGPG